MLKAIDGARAVARARAWALAGEHAPDHGADAKHPVIIDLDASLVGAHSEKEQAARTWKKGCGFHPLCSFLDHGQQGTGEPLATLLRAGNAGPGTRGRTPLWTTSLSPSKRWRNYPPTGPGTAPGAG